ncbi:hypothetical protein N7G274_010629 [Stereocaulon virgatum]|uniref:Peptidase A1 domain-containing protein n=1 Tax=Stereocaulon virgatum TaxID=373712 RepID=A0ABR3ZV53_9LECA
MRKAHKGIFAELKRHQVISSFPRRQEDPRNVPANGRKYVYYYIMYTTDIQLGNPLQPFRAQLNIGWGDLFVPSWNCTYDSCEVGYCLPHNMYNSSQSFSYVADLSPARVHYMGIYTWGNVSQDSLYVGGAVIKCHIYESSMKKPPCGVQY